MMLSLLIANVTDAWKPKTPIDKLVPSVCPNGEMPKLDLEWIHMQDTSGDLVAWDDFMGTPLAKVSHQLDEWFNTDSADNVKFTFYEFNDKPDACLHQPTTTADCLCSKRRFDSILFDDLNCGPAMDHDCDLWEHELRSLTYDYNRARPSAFDPIIDLTANMPPLPTLTDRKAVRVVTVMTDGCSRESGRSTDRENDQARLWKNLEHRVSEFTAPEYSLFDDEGALIEPNCDLRDFPTLEEVTGKLREAETGLAVVYVGLKDAFCEDTILSPALTMTVSDYWNVRVAEAMQSDGVAYKASPTVNAESLYEDLLRSIIEITGNGC